MTSSLPNPLSIDSTCSTELRQHLQALALSILKQSLLQNLRFCDGTTIIQLGYSPTEDAFALGSAWNQVTMLASSADLMVDERLAETAANHFLSVALDGYDLFLLEAIRQTGIRPVQVLTDDMDYATVPNIQVFTANGLVIQRATEQGRLISRGQRGGGDRTFPSAHQFHQNYLLLPDKC